MVAKTQHESAAEQQIAEKEKRIMDAIRMRIPDRVPVICSLGYFVAKVYGHSKLSGLLRLPRLAGRVQKDRTRLPGRPGVRPGLYSRDGPRNP